MSIIERMEEELLAALRDAMPSAAYIAAFPDDAGDFDMAGYDMAALVHYAGSTFDAPAGLSEPGRQGRDVRFAVLLYVRGLRGPAGSYQALQHIRQAVQNRRFCNALPARLVAERLAGEEAGIWQWEVEVSIPTPAVAAHQIRPRTGGPLTFTQQGEQA